MKSGVEILARETRKSRRNLAKERRLRGRGRENKKGRKGKEKEKKGNGVRGKKQEKFG